MSRTYRKSPIKWWSYSPLVDWNIREEEVVWEDVDTIKHCLDYSAWISKVYYTVVYKADSKTGKKMLAKARRDAVIRFKEPGPSWFRNLYTERPLRRQTKRELQKYMADPDYEPMIYSKGKLEYWT